MDEFSSLRLIGKGSYGEVYLAKSQVDSKQYVLKKIKLDSLSEKEKRTAAQEARLLSELSHPNIVSYKDSFHFNGLLHIVMSYCEGGDLNKFLKARNSCHLSESQIIHWFVQIALALQYLHKQNILHRDLKTQNIFLSRNIVKVGDLGIARVLESPDAMARTFIGTPYYMSPEIFQKIPYNYKSDIWALGCCVVEMATLKTAFSAKDLNSLAFKIIVGKQPSIPSNYSLQLKQLIQCLLARDPKQRPSINQLLKLIFIRSHILTFLRERRKNVTQEKSTEPISTDSGKPLALSSQDKTSGSHLTSKLSDTQSDEDDCSLTVISSLQETSEDQNTLALVSTYSTATDTQDKTLVYKEPLELTPTRVLEATEPGHLERIDSEIDNNSNEDKYSNSGSVYLECNTTTRNGIACIEQIPDEKLKELPLSYEPQVPNIYNFQIGDKNDCTEPEFIESEARRRRREQKRQQNNSDALINRYIRRSARNDTQQESEYNPATDASEVEVNKQDVKKKKTSCVKLCSDLLASIDSDEEKMLTLFTSTLQTSATAPIHVDEIEAQHSSSKGDTELSYQSHSQPGDETSVEMLSSIAEIEQQCTQGLGVSLFARSRIMVDKYCDNSEELECNLKLILGQGKFELYFPLLLKLKLFKQLGSLSTSS